MRRPLIAGALLYTGGILLAGLPVPLLSLFALALSLAVVFMVWPATRRITLMLLLVLAGWINLAQRTAILSPVDLRSLCHADQLAAVRGVLLETPVHRMHEVKNQPVWNSHARIQINEIRRQGQNWQPANGQIMCDTRGYLPDNFFAGQTVEISGSLRPAPGPVAEGLFDYRNFLDHQGIYHQLEVQMISEWRIISGPAQPPLGDRFCAWARKALARGLPVEDESLRLEWALTLGWKAALTAEVSEPFMKAATYHIFAVDGLRVAIVTGIFLTLFRVIGIPRPWCGGLILPFLCFYAAMTGWPASAIRALIMISIVFGGWMLKRPSDLLNSLFAAALVILAWEPRQLFQAGFQLSFFVVLCIILILPFFERVGERLFRPDPFLPETLQPRWQKILRTPALWLVDLFLTSVAAWLGSIPLVALYFHLLTPLSGPANVLAVPLCALVLICNLTSLLLAWVPFIAELCNHAGWFLMTCIRSSSNWSAHWPGAYFYVPMPNWFTIGLYYLILIGVLTGWLFKGNWRSYKMGAVMLLSLIWCGLWLWERPNNYLTVLPLTGGHAVFLNASGGKPDWLIDCGNEITIETVTKPFLEAQGVNQLDNFLLTHGEIYYSGGAERVNELFRPQNIYTSQIHFRSPDYRQFQQETKDSSAWRKALQSGDSSGPWRVLYPGAQTSFTKATDSALVLRGEINGKRILLLSDLGHAGQNALLQTTNDLRADFLIAGLPGDSEPLGDALLDAVRPQVIIVADSHTPANKRANGVLKQRLLRRHLPVFYTSISDAVTLTLRPGSWKINAMDGTEISGSISAEIIP